MAESPYEVESFLVDLAHRAKPAAQADLDELKAFAKQRDGLDDFSPWDAPYYAEKLKEKKLGLSDEELRPYFAFDKVVRGRFEVVHKLYGITIEQVDNIERWHRAEEHTSEVQSPMRSSEGVVS